MEMTSSFFTKIIKKKTSQRSLPSSTNLKAGTATKKNQGNY